MRYILIRENEAGYNEQPYEKFKRFGAQSLTESELLAIIIRTGTKGMSALDIAQKVLASGKSENGLLDLHQLSLNELESINGIGEVKAIKIKAILELSKRISTSSAKKKLKLNTPSLVADYFMERMRHLQKEVVYLVMLDAKNQIINEKILSLGTITMSLVSPREVFLLALEYNAVSIILLHNHPSGDCNASREDIIITKRIAEIGKTLEIPLLDHIIIGDNKYTSLKENNTI